MSNQSGFGFILGEVQLWMLPYVSHLRKWQPSPQTLSLNYGKHKFMYRHYPVCSSLLWKKSFSTFRKIKVWYLVNGFSPHSLQLCMRWHSHFSRQSFSYILMHLHSSYTYAYAFLTHQVISCFKWNLPSLFR